MMTLDYSRGTRLEDVRPIQRSAAGIDELIVHLEADRAVRKEGAAYICGPLGGDGQRRKGNALPRRWVAVDLDGFDADRLPDLLCWAGRYEGCGWPTHSSTTTAPRMRILIVLAEPADRDQCIALGEQLRVELAAIMGDGMKWDGCTFRPEQAVHVPPTGAEVLRFYGAPMTTLPAAATVANLSVVLAQKGAERQTPSSVSSVPSVSSVHGAEVGSGTADWPIPPETIPSEEGQRNARLFTLARHVRGIDPAPTQEERRRIVRRWHEQANPAVKTKEFAESWGEFERAYQSVKHPHGMTMDGIIAGIDHTVPLPVGIEQLGYGRVGNLLVRVCLALQDHEGEGPFFLGARTAGVLLGLEFTAASRVLRALVADGVIQLEKKGSGDKASRYRFIYPRAKTGSAVSHVDKPPQARPMQPPPASTAAIGPRVVPARRLVTPFALRAVGQGCQRDAAGGRHGPLLTATEDTP